MNKFGQIIGGILVVILLFFIPYIVFKALSILVNNIDKVSPNLIAALVVGSVTFIGFFLTRYFEKQKVVELQIREKKIPIYESFLGLISKMILTIKKGEGSNMDDNELQLFFASFTEKSIIWMSDETLLAYTKWRNTSTTKGNTLEILYSLEDLLLAFRKDIGHENKNFKRGDLLKTFINDMDSFKANLVNTIPVEA